MSLFVEGDLFGQLRDEVRPFGPWANKAHLALQNVKELGNLIHANLANDATDTRRARIALARPNRSILFGVNSHRAKLHQYKRAAVLAHSLLLVKDRPARLKLDQHSRDQNERE